MKGVDIYTASKLLGHSDVRITEKHYAHLAPDYMGGTLTAYQPKWETKIELRSEKSDRMLELTAESKQ